MRYMSTSPIPNRAYSAPDIKPLMTACVNRFMRLVAKRSENNDLTGPLLCEFSRNPGAILEFDNHDRGRVDTYVSFRAVSAG